MNKSIKRKILLLKPSEKPILVKEELVFIN
jgi:hypothetical protein